MQETGLLERFKILIIVFFFSNFLLSQNHPDSKVDRILRQGISEIIKHNYRTAEKIFQELDENFPQLPLGKIYLAATIIAESYDYETPYNNKKIIELLSDAKKISENLLRENRNDIWNKYYLALTEGYLAYYEALNDNLLKALSVGLNSYNLFDDILQQDSSFQDAMIAVGTYKYWKSDKLKFLSWMPFIDDEREYGIKLLERSINGNSFNSHLAIHSLIWIFIHKKDFNRAKNLTEFALKKFPQSRIFKEALARVYEDMDLEQSISIYYQLLNSYQNLNLENRVKVITLKHKIAIQLQKVGKNSQALKICNEILSIDDWTEYEQNKLSERLERVRKTKRDLSR